jgi:hypothetical protein
MTDNHKKIKKKEAKNVKQFNLAWHSLCVCVFNDINKMESVEKTKKK